MLEKIIAASIRNKFMVVLVTVFIIAGGIYAMMKIPLDAIPDLSDVQVIVFTKYPGQAPQVVEDQVTYPLTTQMMAVPRAKVVRGYSFFGYSFVYIIFEDGTDMYWARSRVLEYLNYASKNLPAGVTPTLGPDATGVGWVYEYTLQSKNHTLQELRSLQDWYLRYQLTSVDGVSEVASIGGYVKQYQVTVDPDKLLAYNIPISRVKKAIQRSNNDVGGRLVEQAETEFMVRGLGYIKSVQDLENVVVGTDKNGTPILIRNIGQVRLGPELRRGLADLDGKGEAVGGVIVMRYGENALKTIQNVKKKLKELQAGLPEGVTIQPVYDRSGLIDRAVETLKGKLFEESAVVAIVTALFLFHLPSALVAIFTLPVAILIAFMIMGWQGINANIMSLGGIAIAIGAMIDAAIIMIENAHKHLEHHGGKKPHWEIIQEAAKEVGPALFYSLLVITVSFFPVFSLGEQSGRMFKPLAYTKTYAMAAAAFLSVTLVPVLMGWFIRGKIPKEEANPINRFLIRIYHPIVDFVLKWRVMVLLVAVLLTASIFVPVKKLGSEFMPPLYEGDLLYMPTTLPGISITQAKAILQQTDRIIASFPEVKHVFGKAGRAETATDPAPLSMLETTITLKPESEWPKVPVQRFYSDWPGWSEWLKKPLRWVWPEKETITVDQLTDKLNEAIKFPGLTNAWTMPIKTRIDMLSTGIKTPVGIKVMGDDLNTLSKIGEQIEAVVRTIPGTLSVYSERVVGGNYLDYEIDREAAARYGLNVGDIEDVIQSAIGGHERHPDGRGTGALPGQPALFAGFPQQPRCPSPDSHTNAQRSAYTDHPGGQHPYSQGSSQHQERKHPPHRLDLCRSQGNRCRNLRGQGSEDRQRKGETAHRLQSRLERPVRVHAGGQSQAHGGHPLYPADHFRDHLHEHQIPGQNRHHLRRPALVAGRLLLVPLLSGLQHVGGGLGRNHRPGWDLGRNRGGHAPLPGPGLRALEEPGADEKPGRPGAGHPPRRGQAHPAQDDDHLRHHRRPGPDHVEPWGRGGRHEAHRRADDRRGGHLGPDGTSRLSGHLFPLAANRAG